MSEKENNLKDKPDRIVIIGRRWFQRSYGNTYHSVEVYIDGELVKRVPFAYGYGNQYLQTAHAILQEAEYYPRTGDNMKDYGEFLDDMRSDEAPHIEVHCHDVSRKRDL